MPLGGGQNGKSFIKPSFLFGDVEFFWNNNPDIGPASWAKLLQFYQDAQKAVLLKLELAAIIDSGKPFVTATYDLEGDGPLVFSCIVLL